MMTRNIVRNLNLPNTLSLARLALVPVAVYLLLSGSLRAAALSVAVCGLLDILDGAAARRLRLETSLGKLLDPLADKLLCAALFITLSLMGSVPYWFTGLVIARDAVISLGALMIFKNHGFQTISIAAGKAALCVLIAAAITAMLFEDYLTPMLFLSCLAMAYSAAAYALAYREFFQRRGGIETA